MRAVKGFAARCLNEYKGYIQITRRLGQVAEFIEFRN
jgi:recombinational DNA repair protein RecT